MAVLDRWKEASTPKASSIRPAVSIQYRLVTDGRRTTHDDSKYRASIASRGKTALLYAARSMQL